MTEKGDCGNHDDDESEYCDDTTNSGWCKTLTTLILSLTIATLLTILITFLILRPTKPHFILKDATLYTLNASFNPILLTTNLQISLSTRNPNTRVGVYYTRLHAYASYGSQQITLSTLLPPTYQGHKESVVWSPFLYGDSVPVAPDVASELDADVAHGLVPLTVNVDARIKWKVGSWVSGKYHLWVTCPVYILLPTPYSNSGVLGSAVKYQISTKCKVNV